MQVGVLYCMYIKGQQVKLPIKITKSQSKWGLSIRFLQGLSGSSPYTTICACEWVFGGVSKWQLFEYQLMDFVFFLKFLSFPFLQVSAARFLFMDFQPIGNITKPICHQGQKGFQKRQVSGPEGPWFSSICLTK